MKLIYKADQSFQAHLLKGLLAENNIDARVEGDLLAGAMGEMPAYGLIHVWVADDNEQPALQIVKKWQAGEYTINDDLEDVGFLNSDEFEA